MLMSMSAGIGAEEGRYIGSAALMQQALGWGSGRGRVGRCCGECAGSRGLIGLMAAPFSQDLGHFPTWSKSEETHIEDASALPSGRRKGSPPQDRTAATSKTCWM